jgi:hypothetical protein
MTTRSGIVVIVGTAILLMVQAVVSTGAFASPGDTMIDLVVKLRVNRLRPSPVTGEATVKYSITLHSDGTVTDSLTVDGNHPIASLQVRQLKSNNKSAVRFKIDGPGQITRFADDINFTNIVQITVKDQTCTATYKNALKPGEKKYATYSVQLGKTAYFSVLEATDVRCTIQ